MLRLLDPTGNLFVECATSPHLLSMIPEEEETLVVRYEPANMFALAVAIFAHSLAGALSALLSAVRIRS